MLRGTLGTGRRAHADVRRGAGTRRERARRVERAAFRRPTADRRGRRGARDEARSAARVALASTRRRHADEHGGVHVHEHGARRVRRGHERRSGTRNALDHARERREERPRELEIARPIARLRSKFVSARVISARESVVSPSNSASFQIGVTPPQSRPPSWPPEPTELASDGPELASAGPELANRARRAGLRWPRAGLRWPRADHRTPRR